MAGRGRPKKEDSQKGQYRLRLNEEEEAMLDSVRKELGKNKAETLRFALKFVHDALKL